MSRGKGARHRERRGFDGVEWIGGLRSPALLLDASAGNAPQLLLWVEQPGGLIVASELRDGDGPALRFADTLAQAIESPLVGVSRHPPRVRVDDEALASELRAAFVDLEVVVAPTPELDELAEMLFEGLGAAAPASYLAGGHEPTSVAALFASAEALWSAAPWQSVDDELLFRVDVPELAVAGAALSVIGGQSEVRGIVLFASHAVHDAFFAEPPGDAGPDVEASALSLTFAPGAELPPAMTREVAQHGWPVASALAYPLPDHRDQIGAYLPLSPRDLRLLTVAAGGLAALCREHRSALGSVRLRTGSQPLSARYRVGGLEVCLSAPHGAELAEEAADLLEH